jgi:glucan phosphoethanolaminetransferase (alkaline phosphatase superfamily)
MIFILILLLIVTAYFLTCAPCRQHLTSKVKNFLVNPKCLLAISLAILLTIIATYSISSKKEIGFFSKEIKCENSIKNEIGIFLSSGDCKCKDCEEKAAEKNNKTAPKTTSKTPINYPSMSPSS